MIIGQQIGFYRDGEFTNGTISGVRLAGEAFYLVVDDEEIAIDFINFVSEAIRLRNADPAVQVSHNGVTGVITQVFANAGHVWIRINNGNAIRMSEFMNIRPDEEDQDIPWAPDEPETGEPPTEPTEP